MTGAEAYYDFEKNEYINYLALKHIYNNLVWQLEQLELEKEYYEHPESFTTHDLGEEELENLYSALIKYLIVDEPESNSCPEISKVEKEVLIKVLKEDRFIVKRIQYAIAYNAIEHEWELYEKSKTEELKVKEREELNSLIDENYRKSYDNDYLTDEEYEGFFGNCS
ncbi:hypothetical protein ACIQYG_20385 [Peribacillus sp. NPDC096622]|uniref:hypothetical protein n=1 Tax=Peribacillus sp. NPDC096622 TaxID=3364396 RepID=UPI00380013F7